MLGPHFVAWFLVLIHLAEEERVGCFTLIALWLSVLVCHTHLLFFSPKAIRCVCKQRMP